MAHPKEFASAWLRPLGIRIAGLALGLVWMVVGTVLSISVYTARIVWAYRHALGELSRLIGVVAFSAAPTGHLVVRHRSPHRATGRRRSTRRPRSSAWLYTVALVGSIVLGWIIGRR